MYVACMYVACMYVACMYVACMYVACMYVACMYVACMYVACIYVACMYVACMDPRINPLIKQTWGSGFTHARNPTTRVKPFGWIQTPSMPGINTLICADKLYSFYTWYKYIDMYR